MCVQVSISHQCWTWIAKIHRLHWIWTDADVYTGFHSMPGVLLARPNVIVFVLRIYGRQLYCGRWFIFFPRVVVVWQIQKPQWSCVCVCVRWDACNNSIRLDQKIDIYRILNGFGGTFNCGLEFVGASDLTVENLWIDQRKRELTNASVNRPTQSQLKSSARSNRSVIIGAKNGKFHRKI